MGSSGLHVKDEMVVLVNPHDQEVGTMEKMEAHRIGALHRAFSFFIFNSKGEWLLQQRANDKYHSGGLWTNACCSHPRISETAGAAATRRLKEEMGLYCQAKPLFHFIYRSEFPNALIENELDHVCVGYSDQIPQPNPLEVASFRYVSTKALELEMKRSPESFTVWFRICYEQVKDKLAALKQTA